MSTPAPAAANGWASLSGLVGEIKRCEDAGATAAAVAMAFVTIDAMARLSLPANRDKQTRDDFIAWVNTYVKADKAQAYQYNGDDVYGALPAARCCTPTAPRRTTTSRTRTHASLGITTEANTSPIRRGVWS